MNKTLTVAIMMFFGSISCYASSFEEKFWISCAETFQVLLVPLIGITLAGLIIRWFGFVGVCFVIVAYVIFLVICLGNQGFPA